MSDPCEDICDALVQFINEESAEEDSPFELSFEVSKPDDPNAELDKSLDTVRVLVWPHGESEEKIGRNGVVLERFSVAMMVVRKMGGQNTRSELAKLTRAIKDVVRGIRMAGYVYSTAETTLTDLEQMHEFKRYACITIFNYVGTLRSS